MWFLLSFLCCSSAVIVLAADPDISFDLSGYDPANKSTHQYTRSLKLQPGLVQIQVINVPPDSGFYVVQVHSFVQNISLSSSIGFENETKIEGTNTGLVNFNKSDSTFYLDHSDANDPFVAIYIVIYEAGDPVPGGCNLTFDNEIAPYQLVSYTDDLIVVKSQPPSAPGTTCERDKVKVEMYHLFLAENSLNESDYFGGLAKMLTVDSIRSNGVKVDTVGGYFKYRKLYSSYKGIGQVFAIVASFKNGSSAYVPAVSYGCDLTNAGESCYGPETPHWKILCAVLLIFGLLVCFFGHKLFRLTLYMMGVTVGVLITYMILSLNVDLSVAAKTTTSVLIGLIYGALWLLVWWKFGSPILSISITFLWAGWLISSVIFYTGVADLHPFRSDLNFWLLHLAIILTCLVIWYMLTLHSHIFACALLGSYGSITALNYYTGGYLQYIMINTFRRIVVADFRMATIDPPFQILDISHVLLWATLLVSGIYYQWKDQKGKPPFPPSRYVIVQDGVSETTPLMRDNPTTYVQL